MRKSFTTAQVTLLLIVLGGLAVQFLSRTQSWEYDVAREEWSIAYAEDRNLKVFKLPNLEYLTSTPAEGGLGDGEDQEIDTHDGRQNERLASTKIATISGHRSTDAVTLVPDAAVMTEDAKTFTSAATLDIEESHTSSLDGPSPSRAAPSLLVETNWIAQEANRIAQAVMSTDENALIRLTCPEINLTRYRYLAPDPSAGTNLKPKYFFALDLFQSVAILPRLMNSIIGAIQFLGPEHCTLSVVEGRSTDGTFEALTALKPKLKDLRVDYYLHINNIDPLEDPEDVAQRIARLAELRNLALSPLINSASDFALDTTVIFVNDVALCSEDVLELLHQRQFQEADMMCGMDWRANGQAFYDVSISRQMSGDSFFEIPQDGSWSFAGEVFWNDRVTREMGGWEGVFRFVLPS